MKAQSVYKTLAMITLSFFLIFFTIACSQFGVTTSTSKQWAYRFVKWDDHFHEVTDETVGQAERGELLGAISTLIYKEGQWQVKDAKITWIS